MKKLLSLFLCFLICLAGCKTPIAEDTESTIEKEPSVIDGYTQGISLTQEDLWNVLYYKGDRSTLGACSYLVVKFSLDDAQKTKLVELSDRKGTEEYQNFVNSLTILSSKDVTDRTPTQKYLDEYLGLDFFAMKDKALAVATSWNDSATGKVVYQIIDGIWYLNCVMDSQISVDNIETVEQLRSLHVESIRFAGFGFGVFDE